MIPTSSEDPLPQWEWAEEFEDTLIDIEWVIAYWSWVLKSTEKNYSPTEKEALTLKEGLIKFQPYLEGERITTITDHAVLTWSWTFQNINCRLLMWGVVYAAYLDLNVVYWAGCIHSNIDPISWLRQQIPFFKSPSADMIEHVELKLASEGAKQKDWQEHLFEQHSRWSNLTRTWLSPHNAVISTEEPFADSSTCWEESEDTVVIVQLSEDDIRCYTEGYTKDSFFSELLDQLRSSTDLDNSRHRWHQEVYICQ